MNFSEAFPHLLVSQQVPILGSMMRTFHCLFVSACLAVGTAHSAANVPPRQDIPSLPIPSWCGASLLVQPTKTSSSEFSSPASAGKLRVLRKQQRVGATLDVGQAAHVWWSVSWDEGNSWVDAPTLANYQSSDVTEMLQRFQADVPPSSSQSGRLFVRALVKSEDGSEHRMCSLAEVRSKPDPVTTGFPTLTAQGAKTLNTPRGAK